MGERRAELFIDGACSGNPGPAGIGAVLYLDGAATPTRELSHYLGEATNNIAEYLALVYGLQAALQLRCDTVSVKTDSELLVRQIEGRYQVRNSQLKIYHDLARHLMQGFRECSVRHIPREQNAAADKLAGQAVDRRVRTTNFSVTDL